MFVCSFEYTLCAHIGFHFVCHIERKIKQNYPCTHCHNQPMHAADNFFSIAVSCGKYYFLFVSVCMAICILALRSSNKILSTEPLCSIIISFIFIEYQTETARKLHESHWMFASKTHIHVVLLYKMGRSMSNKLNKKNYTHTHACTGTTSPNNA